FPSAPLGQREAVHPLGLAVGRQLLIFRIDGRFRAVANGARLAVAMPAQNSVPHGRENHAAHQKRRKRYSKRLAIHCKSPLVRWRLIHTARLKATAANTIVTSQLIIRLGTHAPANSAPGAKSRRTPPTA